MASVANKKKDAAMAAYMKARGIKRTSASCPICHHPVALSTFEFHLMVCKGR